MSTTLNHVQTSAAQRAADTADALAAVRPGPNQPGSIGTTDDTGRMVWRWAVPTETCGECGATVPATGPRFDNAHTHACSLHPSNVSQSRLDADPGREPADAPTHAGAALTAYRQSRGIDLDDYADTVDLLGDLADMLGSDGTRALDEALGNAYADRARAQLDAARRPAATE